MNEYRKLGIDTLYMFIGNMGSKLISFILLPVYTRLLTTKEFGKIELVLSYSNLLLPIFSFLMCEAIFRLAMKKSKEEKIEYFTNYLLLGNFTIIFSFYIFYLINKMYKINFEVSLNVLFLILIVIFNYEYLKQFLKVLDFIKEYSLLGIVYTLLYMGLNLYLIRIKGVNGYFESIIITNLILIIIIIIYFKILKFFQITKLNFNTMCEGIFYVIPLIPTSMIWWVINLSNRIILNQFYSLEYIGIYSVANKFSLILNTIFMIFYSSWQISAVREGEKKEYKYFYTTVFKVIELILTITIIMLLFFLQYFYERIIGKEYIEALKYISVLIFGTLYSSFSSFMGVNYIVFKKTKNAFYTGIFIAILNIILNMILIPTYGILGACLSNFLSYFLFFIIRKIDSAKLVELKISNKYILFYTIWSFSIGFLFYNYNTINMLYIIILIIIYIASNIKFLNNILKKVKMFYNKN
ncbi:oligosaccharide flippase family protein [Fusobacterium mortiferum]|uniref:lipopolysaccharide biosynthesis protein n=1 Tax=Fusobacterium mortiferum TaxID=850 RepID=UPI001F26E420|nr:oligosaccharide flippase family protein [Fusobacterium mortiferum]MCF2628203.1 oligosaccharide flippase family protein [Fusobacterium mortiferum]